MRWSNHIFYTYLHTKAFFSASLSQPVRLPYTTHSACTEILYTPYISRGFYFRECRESGANRDLCTTRKNIYLRSRRMNATCVHNTSSTVHVQGRIANFALSSKNEWMILIFPSIALLLDREFNHSQKCLEVPIPEKLDSRNIWCIQYLMCIIFWVSICLIRY